MPVPNPQIDQARTGFSWGRRALNAGIAVLAFTLTCTGLNAILPSPEIDVVSPNLRFFQHHSDDFDTVFIGSSCIRHQISPAIFDRTMREAGFPTSTLNCGVDAMFPPEDGYVLERLLAAKPLRLKWVFIELNDLETKPIPEWERTRRWLYWHDARRTWLVFRGIVNAGYDDNALSVLGKIAQLFLPGSGKSDARDALFFHGALFARNLANVGRRIDLSRWLSQRGKEEVFPSYLDRDGYTPQSKTISAAEIQTYESELNDAVTHAGSSFVSASTEMACRRLVAEVRKAGATPIFIVTPVMMQMELRFRPDAAVAGSVMSFNNARAYPQLYLHEMRVDGIHLNARGAEEFTRLVAENFSQLQRTNRIR